ncbi:hypothetical protein D9619_002408 [Psilocybe cf. subviscida]|uniref:F-box domain-containing protein n=1 Tax=Psilocybe cf. subviscida TaxID=2480587 RepID=A0A8H5AX12_9AGAR|nr:hypothetical protein D9619_002408 [Psilocybe cf. subviscida]
MLGLLVANFVEQARLQRYHQLKASGPYARNPDDTCPDCQTKQIHADWCPRLLQIAGFHCNFRIYPRIEFAERCAPTKTQAAHVQRLKDPFLCLPPELSSLILWYSLDVPRAVINLAACRGRSYFGPIELALVCRRWYTLAFAEPRLWSTLAVIVDRPMSADAVHVVEACLKRSGGVPLNIRFTAWDPSTSPELISSCARAICGHAARWGDVTLNVHRVLLQHFESIAIPPRAFQNLQVQTFSEGETVPTIGTVAETALRPTRFVYSERDQVYRGDITRLPVFWSDIQSLDLSGITTHDLLHILQQCPRIELMSVTLRDGPAGVLSKPMFLPLTLEHLIMLNLTISSSRQAVIKFFCQISAPHVMTLAVMNQNMMDNDFIPVDVIIAFLQRSANTQLMSLYIRGPCLASKLVRLLELTPKLVTLDITNSPFGQSAICDEFWTKLATVDSSTGSAQFLPQLATFYYIGCLTFRWPLVADACDVRIARPWRSEPASGRRTITSLVVKNHDGFTRDPATFLDRESLRRFLELPKYCLDISTVCLAIDPVLLEYSIDQHNVTVDHDVGLYYSLSDSLKLYSTN